jgi:formylglycine-generating enzyme required for sulfatase activity
MAGNMSEWVNDWYAQDYYKHSPEKNPKGPAEGVKKIYKGGSTMDSPIGWDIYVRFEYPPDTQGGNIGGWRCAIHTDKPLQD